jgi:hypothetical protein
MPAWSAFSAGLSWTDANTSRAYADGRVQPYGVRPAQGEYWDPLIASWWKPYRKVALCGPSSPIAQDGGSQFA